MHRISRYSANPVLDNPVHFSTGGKSFGEWSSFLDESSGSLAGNAGLGRRGAKKKKAFDDDEEFSEDEAADAAAYDNYPQNDHFRRAEPSSMGVNSNSVDTNRRAIESVSGAAAAVHDDAPGDGAPALIQSLFYNGNEGRKGSRVGSRVVDAG